MSPVASLIRTRRTSPWVKGNKSVLADVALTPGPPPTRVSIAN
ncbi:putative collagen triple helix repeat protein [Bacillus cereus 03BB102]|uniref:Collagen triple helix repeat protein n=1 Tax=Bacillus cereus 03BB108 TaxID=451709 RepID=A0AAN0SZ52_BACCE|nr:putative collagen triple helix repeat protein [Bacillus cereus 03BB102]AJI12503.1 putative collagen triple helix repeat protein [Bacillus cereus 03BB108]